MPAAVAGPRPSELAATAASRALAAAPAAVVAIAIAWLAFAKGGYYPTAWGWSALGFCWLLGMVLIVADEVRLSRAELAFVGGIGAFTLWVAATSLWSSSVPRTILEVERDLMYVVAAATLVGVARRSVELLTGSTLVAIATVCGWGLLTRLLPDRIGTFDPLAGYRLDSPLGYWNAVGIVAAIGVLLALGLSVGARTATARAISAMLVPLMSLTLYFTFSRGAFGALVAGATMAVVLSANRLALAAHAIPVLAPAALAVALASRSHALVTEGASRSAAAHDGHVLLTELAVLIVVAAGVSLALGRVAGRIRTGDAVRRATALGLVATAGVALTVALVRYGSPTTIAHRTWTSFAAPAPATGGRLNQRLFSVSSNGRLPQWRVAWREYRQHPALGSGAGTYELYWLRDRPIPFKVRDAHNLYLEVLAEMGPLGLLLLTLGLAAPLAVFRSARAHPLFPALAGAYVAFLVHAAVDWDWEMTSITLIALACGAGLLACRAEPRIATVGRRGRAAALTGVAVLGGLAVVGLIGNVEIRRSIAAAQAHDWRASARWGRRAAHLAPWSGEPWRRVALAQPTAAAARPYFLHAIAKDEENWRLWLELAWASKGGARRAALARASSLNPKSPEIAGYRAQIAVQARKP